MLFIYQVEDTYQQGQEKENEDPESKPDIEGEDNAIEMSEDFEGKAYDGEQVKQGLYCSMKKVLSFWQINEQRC